jgi:hypothetical protein
VQSGSGAVLQHSQTPSLRAAGFEDEDENEAPGELKRALFTVWRGPEDLLRLSADQGMGRKRRSKEELKRVDVLVERLREFVRLNYITAVEIGPEIGVNDSTVYSWVLGQARPAQTRRLTAFLDSFPRQLQRGAPGLGWEGG